MTEIDTFVDAINRESTRLNDYATELHTILDTGEMEARRTVSQLLRNSADRAPILVGQHSDLLGTALRDTDETVCAAAMYSVATITESQPQAVATLATELLESLTTVDDPTARASAIRALATIGHETYVSVNTGDKVFATMLRDEDELVRDAVARNMSINVMNKPKDFPHLLQAYVDGLTDVSPDVRMYAVKTLAVVAQDDIGAVPDIEEVQSRMTNLRNHNYLDTDEVERAIEMIQKAVDGTSR